MIGSVNGMPSSKPGAFVAVTLSALAAIGCGSSSPSQAGAAGAAGGAAGAAGVGGGAGAAGAGSHLSAGCGTPPPAGDKSTAWTKHDIDLPAGSVDQAFVSMHPPNMGSQYSWTHRNYFLKLPQGYDGSTPLPVTIAGTACAGNETAGANGDFSVPPDKMNVETGAIKISQSYVVSDAVSSCVGFADDFANSPEPAYIHAVIAEVEAKYCVDTSKVFINGFDAGAFQAVTASCTNASELRAYGVQIGGGLRLQHAPCQDHPVAAMFVVGTQDTAEPIGPLTTPQNDSNGSAPARDAALVRNGCVGTNTAPWNPSYPKCVTYTGCPAAYPVVWCPLDAPHIGSIGADAALVPTYRFQGLWDFFSSLPAP
jgi:poly(3-hydroxybutyrate) depolymerase